MSSLRRIVVRPSKFGHTVQRFLACDNGEKICWGCAEPCDERLDKYGPTSKIGECCHCGLIVVDKAEWDRQASALAAQIAYNVRLLNGPKN